MFHSILSFASLMAVCTAVSIRSPNIDSGVGLTQLSSTSRTSRRSSILRIVPSLFLQILAGAHRNVQEAVAVPCCDVALSGEGWGFSVAFSASWTSPPEGRLPPQQPKESWGARYSVNPRTGKSWLRGKVLYTFFIATNLISYEFVGAFPLGSNTV